MQRGGLLGFDADDLGLVLDGGGDACDQSASANWDQDRVSVRNLLANLESAGAGTFDHFVLVVSMSEQPAVGLDMVTARLERIGIEPVDHAYFGSGRPDPVDLGSGRGGGNKEMGAFPEGGGGVTDRQGEVSTRRGDDGLVRVLVGEHQVYGTPEFEGPGDLGHLKLEEQTAGEPEIGAVRFEHRGVPDMSSDSNRCCFDRFPGEVHRRILARGPTGSWLYTSLPPVFDRSTRGCGEVRSSRRPVKPEVAGSNPVIPAKSQLTAR